MKAAQRWRYVHLGFDSAEDSLPSHLATTKTSSIDRIGTLSPLFRNRRETKCDKANLGTLMRGS